MNRKEPTPTPEPAETPLRRHAREQREAQERLFAEMARDPMARAMAEAMRPTDKEAAELAGAQRAVTEAEQAVADALAALRRAESARERAPSGFAFFEKSRESRVKAADASVGHLRVDLEEARSALSSAVKRRNQTAAEIDRNRMERRRQVKVKHAPKRAPVVSRGDPWQAAGFGKEAA